MITSRSEAVVRGVATPSEGTVTQGRGVEVSQGPVYK